MLEFITLLIAVAAIVVARTAINRARDLRVDLDLLQREVWGRNAEPSPGPSLRSEPPSPATRERGWG